MANKHGFNTHGVIFDELHTQPNRKLYDVMTQGSGDARMQPLYFLITTAGNNTESICYEVHQKALDIIEGRKIDPTFYPVIYGAGMDEDWTDPKVWKKANPSLGETIGIGCFADFLLEVTMKCQVFGAESGKYPLPSSTISSRTSDIFVPSMR